MGERHRSGATWAGALLLVATMTGCGGSDGDGASLEPVVVPITIEGAQVSPVGERVEVEAGQPIDLEITADAPGELHVHSDPEQELPFEAGTETIKIAIDRPGVVAVESHELGQVIVQLEVQ